MSLVPKQPVHLIIEAKQVVAWTILSGKSALSASAPIFKVKAEEGNKHLTAPYAALSLAIQSAITQLSAKVGLPLHAVRVEIEDVYVFYDIIQITANPASDSQMRQLAASVLGNTFALDANQMVIRYSMQADGRSMIACAIPFALINAIKAAVKMTGKKLEGIQPAFGAFVNRHRLLFKESNAVVARLYGEFLVLGLLQKGEWLALFTQRLTCADWVSLRASYDIFCRKRMIKTEQFPVWFETNIQHLPATVDKHWHRLPCTLPA